MYYNVHAVIIIHVHEKVNFTTWCMQYLTPPSLLGECMICTEDPKLSIGLWHGVMAAAYNGIHVVYVAPNVMATLPTAWLHMIHKHKG